MQKDKKIYGHMKVQIYIWTHEGPSTKEKNDEHIKAHVLKKRRKKDSLVLK